MEELSNLSLLSEIPLIFVIDYGEELRISKVDIVWFDSWYGSFEWGFISYMERFKQSLLLLTLSFNNRFFMRSLSLSYNLILELDCIGMTLSEGRYRIEDYWLKLFVRSMLLGDIGFPEWKEVVYYKTLLLLFTGLSLLLQCSIYNLLFDLPLVLFTFISSRLALNLFISLLY